MRGYSSSIGLDIRLNEIRFIHLRYINNVPRIETMECIALPANAIVEGRIKLFEQVSQTLRTLVQKTHTQHFPTCIALPAQSVISKRFEWPNKLTPKEQKFRVEEQLIGYFPGFSHELCYDYTILSERNNSHTHVLLVATRQEQLNDYIRVAEQAGLSVKIVDIDMYALARAACVAMIKKMDVSPIGILHMDIHSTLFIVVHDNEVTYYSQWNNTIAEETLTTLSNTIQLWHTTYPQLQLNNLYLSGDPGHLSNILPKIQSTLQIKLNLLQFSQEKINVNRAIYFEKTNMLLEKMMVCFGLALRRMPKW